MMEWLSRVIVGRQLGATELPDWAAGSYQILHEQVIDEDYPCFFGVQAEKRGEMFYAFVPRGETPSLIDTMATFARLAKLPEYEKNNVAVFFEPDAQPLSHQEYHGLCWNTLQLLHDADTHPHADSQVDPSDEAWEFCYEGVEMFVVCACPSFEKRRSRNLGPGMVLLFQPRAVFIDKITNKVIGRRAREQVRKRLLKWDQLGAHPDLGFFGDPGNLEWKQYFLPDDNQPHAGACPFLSRRSKGDVPLMPSQEALWFLWRLDPESATHHISAALELEGSVDVATLRGALSAVVERHAILRYRFVDTGGVLTQRAEADAARVIDWNEHDLRGHSDPTARAYQLMQDRGNRGFDLAGDGLLRATLLRLGEDNYVLQVCTHQIVADAASLNNLQRELIECYSAALEGRGPNLPVLPRQFGEYARHARANLITLPVEWQLAYWRQRLGDTSSVLELPLDRPRPARRSSMSSRLSYAMSSELNAGIHQLASAHETTPAVVMLATFALLLQRYSGQSDVRMAVPMPRREPSDSALIGHFMNTAVIRLQVSSTDSFSALIEQAARYLAEARANGDLPFPRLVGALRVPRSLASTPLCQVMFEEVPAFSPHLGEELHVRSLDDGVGRAHYDLSMNVAIRRPADGLGDGPVADESSELFLDYSAALFDATTARRLLAHYLELLEQVTLSPAHASAVLGSLHLSQIDDAAAA